MEDLSGLGNLSGLVERDEPSLGESSICRKVLEEETMRETLCRLEVHWTAKERGRNLSGAAGSTFRSRLFREDENLSL